MTFFGDLFIGCDVLTGNAVVVKPTQPAKYLLQMLAARTSMFTTFCSDFFHVAAFSNLRQMREEFNVRHQLVLDGRLEQERVARLFRPQVGLAQEILRGQWELQSAHKGN